MNFLGPEMLVVGAAVVLLFGAKKLPELARSVGKSVKEFKTGIKEAQESLDDEKESTDEAVSDKKSSSSQDDKS